MTRVAWAIRVACDWPGCKSVGDTGDPKAVSPAGWVYLPDGLNLDGLIRRDFCSIHAGMTLGDLASKIAEPLPEPRS